MYADYAYYTGTYYGTILTADNYTGYASKASDFIDYLTWNKAQDNSELDAVKKCCCALAEQYYLIDNTRAALSAVVTSNGEIQSETVGAHSRTFRSGADTASLVASAEAELANIARRYLLPTGLLYRGGLSCVHSTCCNSL